MARRAKEAKSRSPNRPGRPLASSDRRDSRALLLDAAATVFSESGYRAATVERVVAEAGLSKGTFYWNFASKQDLFLTLLEERIDQPVRALMEVTRAAPADRPTASTVSEGLAQLLEERRETLLLLREYWAEALRDAPLARKYRDRQAALRKTLAEALSSRHEKTGVPLSVPASSLATGFLALAEGLASAALIDPDAVSPSLFGEILSLVYDGLEARAGKDADS